MSAHPDDSEEEVYLSEPPSGDEEEDVRTDDDYEYNEVGEEEAESDKEGDEEFGDAQSRGDSLSSSPSPAGNGWVNSIFKRVVAAADGSAAEEAQEEGEEAVAARVAASAVAAAVAANIPAGGAAPRGLPGLPSRPAPRGGLPGLPARPGLGSGLPPRPSGDQQPAAQQPQQPAGGLPSLPPRPAVSGAAAGGAAANPMLFRRAAPAEDGSAVATVTAPPPPMPTSVLTGDETDKARKVKLQVQQFRTDIYRIALRMKYPTRASVLQQMMYRLGMAERIHLGSSATQQRGVEDLALADAERAEVLGQPSLDFGCKILVLGLQGVGKTATIHSLLGAPPAAGGYRETGRVEVIKGEVGGIPLTFIDTPGLEPSAGAISSNLRKLHAAKRAFNKHKPQAVLYIDRLDAGRRDMADLNVLRSITEVFGQDIWFSTVLLLTHGGAPPPDTSAGQPMTFEMFYQQRGQQAQTLLRQVAGDQRLLNPIALAENSPACPRSEEGDLVLPNGTPWCRQLLMLLFTTTMLNKANTVLKPGEGRSAARGGMQQFMGMKVPPLGWLLGRLVDFRSPRKPPEDEREIKRNDEIRKLSPTEQTVQLRKKRAYLKLRADEARAGDDGTVPILAPEPPLAPSFDPEVNGYRYQVLESSTGIIARPVISEGAMDHQDGIDTMQVEKQAILRPKGQYLGGVPSLAWAQLQKDKTQFTFQGEAEGSYFHSSKWTSTAACNVQTIGRDVLYTPRVETRLKTGRRNKVAVGALFSRLGEEYSHPFNGGALAYGLKLDDRVRLAPNVKLRGSVGRMYTKAGPSVDHGTALAWDCKIKPSQDESARILVGGTAVWQRRDCVMGGNLSTEFRLPKKGGRGGKSDTMCSMNANLNNKGNGQLVMRLSSHDYPQLAASMAVPVLATLWQRLFGREEF